MKDDNVDACILKAQVRGGKPAARDASMVTMDTHGIEFMATMGDGARESVRIDFLKPVTSADQIRGHIVALTRRARATQES